MPDFDIGTDAFHTPDPVGKGVSAEAKRLGFRAQFNSPYGGSIVPMKFYQKDRRVISVMIEANRKLYMDLNTMQKTAGFERTRIACNRLMYAAAYAAEQYFGSVL